MLTCLIYNNIQHKLWFKNKKDNLNYLPLNPKKVYGDSLLCALTESI